MVFGRTKKQSQQPVQVVIVDDEEDLCQCVRWNLDQYKISSAAAHDGEAGLNLIRERKPQLVLLDIKMPRKNGYQVLADLQQDAELKRIPVFVMTSMSEGQGKSDEEWARSLGVSQFISKPFVPEEVAQKIAAHFGISAPTVTP